MSELELRLETVAVGELRPHPRNYREHPDDQLDHLVASIREHGLYRNIVIARDGTVLAGHGVLLAVQRLGIETVPVYRLDVAPDDPRALKVLTGDNEIGHLGQIDDRALTEILKSLRDADPLAGLLGTGFDDAMLASLVMVTRPQSEIADADAAAHWVGMPAYEDGGTSYRVVVNCRTPEDRAAFLEHIRAPVVEHKNTAVWSLWWPLRPERNDLGSVRFEA